MSLLPKPDDPIPLSDAAEYAQAALAKEIGGMYANAMQIAENAVWAMTLLAKTLQEHIRRDPGGLQQAMDAAGFTTADRMAFARFLEITELPFYDKLASGCFRLGHMANARREAKEST
jgi:hypothetical protein